MSASLRKLLFASLLVFCLTPWASPPLALGLGLGLALTAGNPFAAQAKKFTPKLLQYSVVGLGFGMNAHVALAAGRDGLLLTVVVLSGTIGVGYLAGRWLKLSPALAHLIACGTAICGGSAIAAIGPVAGARDEEMSVALGTVFVLNAVGLFLFPPLGHALGLSAPQFGLWCALAIHDTSSVVGAATAFGDPAALQVATTVKLARALWIIPVALATAPLFKQREVKAKVPWFIVGFVAAMLLNTYVPALHEAGQWLVRLAKIGLTVTLFFIGANLSAGAVRAVGPRPFLLGVGLWLLVSSVSLWAVMNE